MNDAAATLAMEIAHAARDILADMAFLDVSPVPDGTDSPSIGGPWASIEVKGDVNGLMVLMLPLDLKINLIEGIFSIPWDDLPTQMKDDGLLEILNVIAGRYSCSYGRTDGFLKLSIPSVVFGEEDLPSRPPEVEIVLDAEGTLFKIIFFSSEVSV